MNAKGPRRSRGRFVSLEGGEGAGKSTQIALLAEDLAGIGIDAIVTREPGGAPSAEEIRTLLVNGPIGRWQPMSEALLNYAARVEHVSHTIEPALAGGQWVLCDRFSDSTVAYQGYGHDLGGATILELHALVLDALAPDLTIILDIPVEAGLARAGRRAGDTGGGDRYERMDQEFHERIRDGFLDIARRDPDRCVVIDAAADVETVHADIAAVVASRLKVDLKVKAT